MKSVLFILSFFTTLLLTTSVSAQAKTQKIKVSGECGMCKKKIETSAKTAGATYAVWNADDKQLTVKYDSKKTTAEKIEKAVAAAGYDTEKFEGNPVAYEQLDECCKYQRRDSATKTSKPDTIPSSEKH